MDNIVRMQHMTRVPKSQSYYIGVINLRGEVVPIMSLRRRFGLEDDVCQSATRIIIIRMQDQSLIGVRGKSIFPCRDWQKRRGTHFFIGYECGN